jgi:hypothetical protein
MTRKLLQTFACLIVLLTPTLARADLTAAFSVGSGIGSGPHTREPTVLMVAPGLTLLGSLLRFELGLAFALPDTDVRSDLDLRPMLVLQPLSFLYGRATFGVARVVHDVNVQVGLGVGLQAHLATDVALFAELGYVPRFDSNHFDSVMEGRVGIGVGY